MPVLPDGERPPNANATFSDDGVAVMNAPKPALAETTAVEGRQHIPRPARSKQWLHWATVTSAYLFTFWARVAPSGIVDGLKDEFHVSNSLLGTLGAEYFYLYVIIQVPIGAAMSTWGVRKVTIAGMAVALVGQVLFSLAPAVLYLHIGRVLVGVGVAASFLGFVTVTKNWFRPEEAATMMGLSIAVGVLGATLGQSPLSAIADVVGWRVALLLYCAIPVGVLFVAFFCLDDFGPYAAQKSVTAADVAPLREQWRIVKGTRQVWLAGMVGFFTNAIVMSFSGLWATPFFEARYGISSASAGLISSAAFIGNAVGGPVLGKLSDKFHLKRSLSAASCTWQAVGMVVLIYTSPPIWVSVLLCFIIGFGVTINVVLSTVRSYLRSMGTEKTISLAGGVMNTLFLASPIILQPLVGIVLDAQKGDADEPSDSDYQVALLVFPVCAAVGACLALFLKTEGQPGFGKVAPSMASIRFKQTDSSGSSADGDVELGVDPQHSNAAPSSASSDTGVATASGDPAVE